MPSSTLTTVVEDVPKTKHMVQVDNVAAKHVSYYTPQQDVPAGTASVPQPDQRDPPLLFQPLKVRGLTLQNRIVLSPLCQYSADDGHHTDWHFAHLGGIISRGPGLSLVEATAILPEGRITPQDSGLWKDSQIEPLRRIVEFAHSQGQKIGIQLAHAGRKASTVAPWLGIPRGPGAKVNSVNGWENDGFEPVNGWPDLVKGPSPIPYKESNIVPKEMTLEDIAILQDAWVASVKRSVKAGFDAIEIHGAHGYLINEFLSPISNQRRDHYGGSFENRIRLAVELVDRSRAHMPTDMPLLFRVSATEWLEHDSDIKSWGVADTIKLATVLSDHGVDILDVSSGGNDPRQKIAGGAGYQAPFAKAVKKALGERMVIATVGSITSGTQANDLLEAGLDLVLVGRLFQKNPGLVWTFAEELGVEINVASQIRWGFGGRQGARKKREVPAGPVPEVDT